MPKRASRPASTAHLPAKMDRLLTAFGKLNVKERRQFVNALKDSQSDVGPTNPKLGNRRNPDRRPNPPTSQFTKPTATDRDYFRDQTDPGQYNNQPDASITPARVTLSVRMRNNPIKGLTFDRMTAYLDQWRLGFFRMAALAWDTMERRDYQLQIVRPKRLKSVARHGYDVLTVELPAESQKSLAEEQKTFLKNFYDQATATTALNPDEEGGVALLVRQMMDAVGKFYAVHEIIWQPGIGPSGTDLTARFIFCPIWWFEGTRGKLRFLPSEFQIYGNDMLPGEWVVTCGDGIMETCSIIYLLKYLPLKSWITFLDKFAMPGIHGKTDAQKGSKEWNDFVEALQEFGEEWATATNRSAEISLIEAKSTGNPGYEKIVELMDLKITQLWRGADLGTQSSQDGTGASLQEDESEILETDDATLIEETLNKKVSHYALEWKYGVGCPKLAYLKLRTTPRQNISDDLLVDEFLAKFKDDEGRTLLGKQSTLERYSRPLLKDDEDALKLTLSPAPINPALPGKPGEDAKRNEFDNEQQTKADIATTLHETVLPILKRIEAIAQIEDVAIQQHLLEKLLRDFPQIAAAIKADDSLAKKLSPLLERELMTAANPKDTK